ncbi:hypothetical protein CTM50_08575 [Prevotella intermedia]|uniref:Uncharacterized protein n=1 Tax=Prevotella intermedia TaxID=28131 RepID=A0A2D3NDQ0_PREIN|nr:hypothetical protein CTM50_08575 [Prevotella intermedia]
MNTLQNLLFCVPKAALLHGKSVGFAAQKSRFRNAKAQLSFFKRIIFIKQGLFIRVCLKVYRNLRKTRDIRRKHFFLGVGNMIKHAHTYHCAT